MGGKAGRIDPHDPEYSNYTIGRMVFAGNAIPAKTWQP
jgi:hypothetical protein